MIIYVDNDCKCHLDNDGTMTEIKTDFFDGKCEAFIKGYRAIPENQTWTREDGRIFSAGMIAPWKDTNLLMAYQEQYEETQAALNRAYQNGVNSI